MTSAYESGNVPEIQLHHRLRIAREFAQLEQTDLAVRMGISRQSVSAAESGRKTPRKITLNAWALACGVPVSWLITGKRETPPPGDGGAESRLGESNPRPIHYKGSESPENHYLYTWKEAA